MQFWVSDIFPNIKIEIFGASYAGSPRDNTVMYITKKVEKLINNLKGHSNCVCFVDEASEIPEDIEQRNAIIRSNNPAFEYARFATTVEKKVRFNERLKGFHLTEEGYYIGTNVEIGNNAYIEPGVVIGHDTTIGSNAVILAGSVIRHATIGNDFICNENAVVGDYSFTMAEDDDGNKYRIPALGKVIIGDHVEVGACNDVAVGACGDTILDNYVKLDGLVHIGHEAHLHENVEVTAGAIIAGFADIKKHTYLGINSSIKNRKSIGEDCVVGMGAVVTKDFDSGITVIGNPAREYKRD
ncbi:DapH/DapD/GlmU-related protein [Butyrivibrio fibrisolvens]|uniref:DapH/DapD/GlmU-related protein n=1 Tax=Butyrivibrio fibrisolvens TaxID=831 RepID=UPI0004808780|nr:DapH/DapD/GlmU-related protein [Butyrivibrio fibrisolvens]